MINRRIQVLLVEDDPDAFFLLEQVLSQTRERSVELQFHFSNSLETAFEQIAKGNIDVILLDLYLPDSRGIETFHAVTHRAPEIPVVILSVFEQDPLVREAVQAGAQDYFLKRETHLDFLVRVLQNAMERHKLTREINQTRLHLERLALIDSLTGLFNQRGLEEILTTEMQRAKRKESNLLVLLVDLDDFKKMNHSLGHAIGDVILKEVAHKLKNSLRTSDYVARVGGDEFVILLPETRLAEGIQVAEKIRFAISTTVISLSHSHSVKITASLHVVDFPEIPNTIHDMMMQVHGAKMQSRKAGRNQVSCDFQSVEGEEHAVQIRGLLRRRDQFRPMMQPIFRLDDLSQMGYEFLTRSMVKGFEMPDDFFRICLEADMLTFVDHECLRTCLNASELLPSGYRCHFNLFPSTMIGLPIKQLIEAFQTKNSGLSFCVEISEQQIIGDPAYLKAPVQALKEAGVLIAIDDLGFGRSCLESLILLEPDIVKIDKKCVIGIAQDMAHARSLKRLLNMARSLGTEVIAEGIETKDDLEMLKYLGVKYGQGFLLGKPFLTDPYAVEGEYTLI